MTGTGYSVNAATLADVNAHYASTRPARKQTPRRDLSVREIRPLSEVGFDDWKSFGVKAANVAVLGTLGFPSGTVPDGFAIPFYFYDEFMELHGFYDRIRTMLADTGFQTDFDIQEDSLKVLRKAIRDAAAPQWMSDSLAVMHATYPAGQSLRYRSSTNNEDLPGFNGAGLYDSKTQHPEETDADGIDKSLKQVWASLWNFRAFVERDFQRIDHLAAAMGVLVHPNYTDELANGVALSFDPGSDRYDRYYVNTQLGEDLVTNPPAHAVPEEVVLRDGGYSVLATSNLVDRGTLLMNDDQMDQLRRHLSTIHDHFKGLYTPSSGDPFAMEIEFKITSENVLAIKQARPWVFEAVSASPPPPPRPPPPPPRPPPPPPPPPQQPVSPAVTGVSTMSVTVSWTAPTGDGPLIRNYDVRYREGSAGEWKDGPQDVRNTSATIEGLDPDTAYEVQVRSSSSSLHSEWSALITTRTLAPPPPPVAPEVTETTPASVTVGWTAPPADAGLPVTGYDLRYRTGINGDWMAGPPDVTGTSAIITGLEPDTEYEIQVRSNSAAGDGEWTVLGTVRTEVLILYDLFSISLDLDPSEADQTTWMLNATPGVVVPVQVFASDIRGTRGVDLRVGYDATQVVFAGFDVGDALPGVTALVKQDSTSVEIGVRSLSGNAMVDSGRVGTVSFRTTDALTETEIRVAEVNVARGEHPESMTRSVSILLQAAAPPSADFDGSGHVAFADFVLFAGVFGTGEGDGTYDARFDLNGDGGIRFDDFVIFAAHFGDTVNRAPVFDAAPPVTLRVAGNASAGEPIGEPVAATDADGNTLTYSLWGADAEHFAIDAGTGQILAKGTYDFEKKKGYAVIVRATDGKGGIVSTVVRISVSGEDSRP